LLLPFVSRRTFHEIGGLSAGAWGWMVLLGVGSSVVGYFIFVWALRQMEATKVSVFLYAVPVVALLASWIVLDENLGPPLVLAAAMVIAGVWMAQQERAPTEEPVAALEG
jgi:drug/metabolite transporter (DMT)-like permease